MAKRHHASDLLISQVRRCQELIMARSGVDEFYETIRLLIAKHLAERDSEPRALTYSAAQELLSANSDLVQRFVEGESTLCAPPNVADECLRLLTAARVRDSTYAALHTVFEQMTGKHYKSDKGQYFTPSHVVDFCISVLRPRAGELVCDPACGSGAFLKSAYDCAQGSSKATRIYGFDYSKRAAKTAALLSYLACDERVRVEQVDSLNVGRAALFDSEASSIEEFMGAKSRKFKGFDVIATNPPFAGDVSSAEFMHAYETSRLGGIKVERDILFLERCLGLLKDGGRLAIVLPDNKISGTRYKPVREWLMDRMQVIAVVSLHSYTFRPYTSQKACVLFGVKARAVDQTRELHLYRSDKAGKSSNGDMIEVDGQVDHDLDEIARDLKAEWQIG